MDRRTDGQTLFYTTLPAKAGGQKNPLVIKFSLHLMIYQKLLE